MTPESDRLCRMISKLTDGVTILAFSRGKDSLAAWLYLRNYFDTIIPYTAINIPGLKFVDRSIEYAENFFNTKIHRVMHWVFYKDHHGSVYQNLSSISSADNFHFYDYEWEYVEYLLAEKLGYSWAENIFTAHAVSMYDSLDRIGWVRKCNGKKLHKGHFYPCFNWKPTQVRDIISKYNVSLPEDYLMSNRTLSQYPNTRYLYKIKELYPDDFETIKFWYPLIECQMAKQEFRELKCQKENQPTKSLKSLKKSLMK